MRPARGLECKSTALLNLYRAKIGAVRAVETVRMGKAAFLAAGAVGVTIELSALPWQPGKATAGGILTFLLHADRPVVLPQLGGRTASLW